MSSDASSSWLGARCVARGDAASSSPTGAGGICDSVRTGWRSVLGMLCTSSSLSLVEVEAELDPESMTRVTSG